MTKSEHELIELLKEGDEKAFEFIFDTYFESLCLLAKGITKNHEAAEDIVEEIFLQLWLNCQINPVQTSIKGYLYKSVYNNSIKYLSRDRSRLLSLDAPGNFEEPVVQEYPLSNLIARELEDKAREIIQSLPDQCRQIYQLNRSQNLKYHEIAERLNITVGTVKTQMSRAYARLREGLKDLLAIFL